MARVIPVRIVVGNRLCRLERMIPLGRGVRVAPGREGPVLVRGCVEAVYDCGHRERVCAGLASLLAPGSTGTRW